MEYNYSFLQRYHIIYDQPKEQEIVTFRIFERGINLCLVVYFISIFLIFLVFYCFRLYDCYQ